MSKPRENKNGAGKPRNKRSLKNWLQNENLRRMKELNHGLGQREVRRNLLRSSGQLPYPYTHAQEDPHEAGEANINQMIAEARNARINEILGASAKS